MEEGGAGSRVEEGGGGWSREQGRGDVAGCRRVEQGAGG